MSEELAKDTSDSYVSTCSDAIRSGPSSSSSDCRRCCRSASRRGGRTDACLCISTDLAVDHSGGICTIIRRCRLVGLSTAPLLERVGSTIG